MSANEELASNIDKTRKQITTLFTDIVDSSRYWDQFGDVRGRMMIDHHNRLVFPVIRKFGGRIVKTIGDGLMAVFRNPNEALKAAIAIQQILQKMRNADSSFHVHLRIGIHTGVAIVEKNDVYGDAINVAKRVESFGGIDEIVLSEVTAELVQPEGMAFHKKGSFVPKGKSKPLTVYRCRWGECRDLTHGLKASSDIPLDAREKGDIAAYTVLLLIIAGMLYQIYGRYFLADWSAGSLHAQLLALNPLLLLSEYTFLAAALSAIALTLILVLIRIRTAPYMLFRVFKGIAGFGLGFLLVYTPVHYFSLSFATSEGNEVFKSEQVFVRVTWQDSRYHLHLPLNERNWYAFFTRELIIPADSPGIDKGALRKITAKNSAGSPRASVAGVWSMRNIPANASLPFYFRLFDLCAICAGIVGFTLGFMNFTIRPS
ncbi:MAG TPA: adenylate/guanylate cyclase domain-containing protein [Gammaproteobacteria bacterium]|nr:adenylate/guanylate cyclase domain-containing protein [Gammaproteobacteria bacterium]